MSNRDPIVQTVAEALHADQCPDDECDGGDMGEWERQAEIAVDAARPLIEREAKAEAIATLREFARAQDTWCEAGRADQLIRRAAMRDALLREADRIEGNDQ